MSEFPSDRRARERFRDECDVNFAVSANAGSGKTTAISERLAAIALGPDAAERLRRTAVVTYTKKAAGQIGQRARQVLQRRLAAAGRTDPAPLEQLDRAFFGTIHSFCLQLARTHGQTIGINLNPSVVTDGDDVQWEEFVETDPMTFEALGPAETAAWLRHLPLEDIFALARSLDHAAAAALLAGPGPGPVTAPSAAALEQLLALPAKGRGAANILASQDRARAWAAAWTGRGFLPLYEPAGSAEAVRDCADAWMAPLERWLAAAAARLAAELAERYRRWRFARGIQTYADQIEAALAVLGDDVMLDRIRGEGWRIVLDEAQDTDPQQFAVLVELARPPGAERGAWPGTPGAVPPRPGHFCLVGDGQQAIYGSRADLGNFRRHVDAYRRGDGGECLEFDVTFRTPHAVVAALNRTLPAAFGRERPENLGLPPAPGAPPPYLQVPYVPLVPGPANRAGWVRRFALQPPAEPPSGVGAWLAEEARQVADWLRVAGPAGLGVRTWGEVAVLAPRNDWLAEARRAFEHAGLEVALQSRRARAGDNPAYAWLAGLLAVCANPDDSFEWTGVLREVFGVSDALLAAELRRLGAFSWQEPDQHPEPLAGALATVRPFIVRRDDAGQALGDYVRDLATATRLAPKAAWADPAGGANEELERLLAEADAAGLEGAGLRAWLDELRRGLDAGRPAGRPSADAINLLTSHSAKGLEWPVVIVLGLWRGIGQASERGLKLVRDPAGVRVYFDSSSLPPDTRTARDRERVRELIRLLYVTLTRPREGLLVPWLDGFGGRQRETPSFADLWGADIAAWPDVVATPVPAPPALPPAHVSAPAEIPEEPVAASPLSPLPERLLPHELAHEPDRTRAAGHESGEELRRAPSSEEAIEYGLWWHGMLEFLPWSAAEAVVSAHVDSFLAEADRLGFGERGRKEWALLRAGPAWAELRHPRWERLAELGVFAPLRADAWIDGVMDLVLHDATGGEVWVVDWKTNRRRPGESDPELLARLAALYAPQLHAYGDCLAVFFPRANIKRWVFASAAGAWTEVPARGQ